jgi:hypothetical protein
VQLPAASKLHGDGADGEVTVGIRPEDLMWQPAAGPNCTLSLTALVDVVEPMGHEAYVTAVCAGETVTSRFPPRSGVRTRERVELALNPARLHIFDARTGESIMRRPAETRAETLTSTREAWVQESAEGRQESPGQSHEKGVPTSSKSD